MAFIGTAQLIRQTTLQTALFKDWIVQAKWRNFWGSGEHFDWWAFPIDANSDQHGDRYNVTPALNELRNSAAFLEVVLENAQLLSIGLGYSLEFGQVSTLLVPTSTQFASLNVVETCTCGVCRSPIGLLSAALNTYWTVIPN